jgi:hypothetical protein
MRRLDGFGNMQRPVGGIPEEPVIPIIEWQTQNSQMSYNEHAGAGAQRILSSDRGHFFLGR